MTKHTNCNCNRQTRWIRVFTAGNEFRDMEGNWCVIEGAPKFGDFMGTIRFDRIVGIYPNQRDDKFLNVNVKGERNETYAFTMIMRSDLHQLAPELAVTFPLPTGGQ
ncbi:hypothetical protein [Ruegeria arenilitoris]|uniref:hypothetical protein n=1 Tax=Ruegeria arenilitoris TaxID=1173585 RepID=UPI003C7E52EC